MREGGQGGLGGVSSWLLRDLVFSLVRTKQASAFDWYLGRYLPS